MLSKLILKLAGWKIASNFHDEIKRCVLVVAPHTSNWDFIVGRLVFNVLKLNVHFLIKKEAFVFPLGYFLKKWGGIPVERSKKSNLVKQVAKQFEGKQEMVVVITPEGTRSPVKNWKKGFYHIAAQANVPIVLGYLDYKKKEVGLGTIIYPGNHFEDHAAEIKAFYADKTAKHPENFNLQAITTKFSDRK